MPKQNKMMQMINSRLRLTLQDGRIMTGQLLAFDKHMNLVLVDVEEFRTTRAGEQRRSLGFIVLRGRHIISMCPEGVPDVNKTRTPVAQMTASAFTAGEGVLSPGMPLTGPAPGMYMTMPYNAANNGTLPAPGMPMPPPSRN